MSGSSDLELLRRLVDFELELKGRSAERIEQFDWGRLILNPKTSAIWTANLLDAESRDVDAELLAALADDLLGGRGMDHRFVVPRDAKVGEELAPGFRELGWDVDRSLYMVLRRSPDRRRPPAVEVSREQAAGVRRAVAEADPDFTPDAIDQRLIRDARLDSVANGRWFAAPANEEPRATCVLYELDGVGQVETVGTKP